MGLIGLMDNRGCCFSGIEAERRIFNLLSRTCMRQVMVVIYHHMFIVML